MKILKRVRLHSSAFCGGTNLNLDLDTEKRTGMRLLDDPDASMVYVQLKNDEVEIPYTNIVDKKPLDSSHLKKAFDDAFKETEKKPEPTIIDPAKMPQRSKPKITAQYETPMSHVHAGPGAGKARD